MQITVYTSFSKRKNSTKVPTGGTTVNNVELKNNTSIHSPTFILGNITGVTMNKITYVKAFDEYYFVTDVSVTPHNYWEITCVCDPMASHKSEITGSKQFVVYSASDHDDYIADARISQEAWVDTYIKEFTKSYYSSTGYYVLTCLSEGTDGRGAEFVTNYMLEPSELQKLAEDLIATDWSASAILNVIEKPFNSVVSLRFIPLSASDVRTQVGSMTVLKQLLIGNTPMDTAQGYIFPSGTCIYSFNDSLTPGWNRSDDWRIAPPYTTGDLFLPGYGTVEVNPLQCQTDLTVEVEADAITGDVTIYILGKNALLDAASIITTLNFNVAVQVPIAQLGANATGTVASLGGGLMAAAGMAMGGIGAIAGIGGMVAGASGAILNLMGRTASVKGSIAGKSWLSSPPITLTERVVTTKALDSMNDTQGRPLMEEKTLSSLSGYCQCQNASVSINGFDEDRDYINNTLNSGFFLE